MGDLRFMIVNSNLQHAQPLIHELKSRVSFPVYQDTKEKNIWSLMDGGKDDIFVYDRCGRLAYYIPFPLSIMSAEEGTLVTSAILATYHRSPCGTTCDRNSSTLEDFLNSMDSAESPLETTTEESSYTTELYKEITTPNQAEDVTDLLQANTSSVDEVAESKGNFSELNNFVDSDYPSYDDTLEDYNSNETSAKHDPSSHNSLYKLFFNSATTEPPVTQNTNETIIANISSFDFSANSINIPLNISYDDIPNVHNHTEMPPPEMETTNQMPKPKPKPDRCAEADPSVCKNWSKKRLMRAHNCCTIDPPEGVHQNQMRFCKNFGKKRCKKIRTILKCCIKTALFETTTVDLVVDEVTTVDLVVDGVTTVATTDVVADVKYDVVCCKDIEDGKMCRVSEEPACRPGEYIQENAIQSEEVAMLGSTM